MNANQVLISVITPYYEFDHFLRETIDCVRAQTYQNWEMIVVDDCSPTKPSDHIINSYNDARLHNVRAQKNSGTGASRNLAIKYSRGEYLLILDSDDLISEIYMEKVLGAMLQSGAEAGYSNVKCFGMLEAEKIPHATIPEILVGGFPYNTLILKRSLFDKTDGYASNLVMEDTQFWLKLLRLKPKFAHVEELLYRYRMHPQSRIQTSKNTNIDFYYLLKENKDLLVENIDEIIDLWIKRAKIEFDQSQDCDSSNIYREYAHLQSEFNKLLKRYEEVERQNSRNERILSSLPQLQKQIAYLIARKIGLSK